MKLSDLKAGDIVQTDDGFTCLPEGQHRVEADDEGELYIHCSDGKHFLSGQEDEETGELIGLSRPFHG